MRGIDGLFSKSSIPVKIISGHLRKSPKGKAAASMLDHFDMLLSTLEVDHLDITIEQLEHGLDRGFDYVNSLICGLGRTAIKEGIQQLISLGYLKKKEEKRLVGGKHEVGVYSLDRQRILEDAEEIQGRKATRLNRRTTVNKRPMIGSGKGPIYGRNPTHSIENGEQRDLLLDSEDDDLDQTDSEGRLLEIGLFRADARKFRHVALEVIESLHERALKNNVKSPANYVYRALANKAELSHRVNPVKESGPVRSPVSRVDFNAKVDACADELEDAYYQERQRPEFDLEFDSFCQSKRNSRTQLGSKNAVRHLDAFLDTAQGHACLVIDYMAETRDVLESRYGNEVLVAAKKLFLGRVEDS